jgi:hypothetical protein
MCAAQAEVPETKRPPIIESGRIRPNRAGCPTAGDEIPAQTANGEDPVQNESSLFVMQFFVPSPAFSTVSVVSVSCSS